ncbi:TRP-domain-containing protein, partial [Hortaea werneckii]
MIPRIWTAILATIAFFCCLQPAIAADDDTRWVTYQTNTETIYLRDDRRPALYTGNFGDCLGGSSINVTRFDAAYYKDNMTVLFHLAGNSGLMNQSLMMYIGVYAYGESRFDLTFNPCAANIDSLCPINSSVPIEASGIIPVNQEDVAGVPPIALTIPDFEGEAILRIFANETESEIGCYSAVITNGATFSHPEAVGSILGIFAFIAMVASFVTAAYGEAVPTMRLHYAHSLSVGVVFAVFQHIFYTGALSMNWPSVLVAWWSNFAWAGGMIYSSSMQNSIYNLIGTNVGNTSQVGAAQAGSTQESLGGGYDISQIYKRAFSSGTQYLGNHPLVRDIAGEIYRRSEGHILKRDFVQRSLEHSLAKRELANASSGFEWYGQPVAPGLPLPGNYSGFAGTLAVEQIPASNAFMTGFLWFLICLVL